MATNTIADAPFDDPADSVDLVIRTSDNVDFYVLSGLLSLKSPSSFFRNCLKSSQHTEERDGYPVLEVKEDSDTFRTILLFCYPHVTPRIESVEQIMAVKKALDKYCMDYVLQLFIQAVITSPLMKEQALRIFAHAVANGWRVLGEAAAKCALSIPQDGPEAELEDLNCISTLQYIRLRNYHRACTQAAQDVLSKLNPASWPEGKPTELALFLNSSEARRMGRRFRNLDDCMPSQRYVHAYFTTYLAAVKAELLQRPHPDTALNEGIIADTIANSIIENTDIGWRKIASSQILLCGESLKREIDKQISQVPLNIDWTE